MITYNLKINKLNVTLFDDKQELENVVYSVEYIIEGKDEANNASAVRTIGLNSPDKANFKSLASLTSQDIIDFVYSSVAPDDIQCAKLEVQENINKIKSPVSTSVAM